MEDPLDLLRKYWGYDAFRPAQREIIDSVLAGRDTLGLLPTGGGKSITFQVPALMLPGLTVVVTPLISLMRDQVDNLRSRGIRAACLFSGMTWHEQHLAMDRCRLGKVKLLYVSPERLRSETFMSQLALMRVSLLVVDEAHCISQWGYDFRPSYLQIASLRRVFSDVPVLALTASATPQVVDDIMRRLEFDGLNVISRSFARPNISYLVRMADYKEGMVAKILKATTGSAIVYVRSRRRTREIAEALCREGIRADYYHAGLAPELKGQKQDQWKHGDLRVIVATNAFGMGIDKPDVRVVIHTDLPPSLEEYYQESGRAGRDGQPAFAVIVASTNDKGLLARRVSEAFPPRDFITRVYELAGDFLQVAVGEGYGRVFEFNFNLFCTTYHLPQRVASSALGLLSRLGYIEYVDETTSQSRLMVIAQKEDLYGLRIDNVADSVLEAALRTYPGLFADYVRVDEGVLSTRAGVSRQQVYESLLMLSRMRVISYVPRKTSPYVVYSTAREEARHIVISREVYDEQRQRMAERAEAMRRFVYDGGGCRVAGMLRYFGQKDTADCGKCDMCRSRKPSAADPEVLRGAVRRLASQPGGVAYASLVGLTGRSAQAVAAAVRAMLDSGELALDPVKMTVAVV